MIRYLFLSLCLLLMSISSPDVLTQELLHDNRDNFQVDAFVGLGIDSFAANDVNDYLNPDELGDSRERATAGFEFSYRLRGDADQNHQVWMYGRTIHGVRSTDIDCKASNKLSVCEGFHKNLTSPDERGLYVLRNASSLEAMIGLRWEFAQLQHGSMAYINGQLGFVAVTDDDDDVSDVSHIGIGGTLTNGPYRGSFIEFGVGRNDLLNESSYGRYKVNARVVKRLQNTGVIEGFFAHIATDLDYGDGPDSVQTYLGLLFKVTDTQD